MTQDEDDARHVADLQRVRRAVAVLDMVESVRRIKDHEEEVIDAWRRFRAQVLATVLPRHGGRMVKSMGDAMLLEFAHAASAVQATLDAHRVLARLRLGWPAAAQFQLHSGVNVCEVRIDEVDIYGHGVNVAARLASEAPPDGIHITADVQDGLVPGLDVQTEDLGELWLKSLDEPIRVYRVLSGDPSSRLASLVSTPRSLLPCIAVLPFAGEGAGSESAMLGELVADDLVSALSADAMVRVVSPLSAAACARHPGAPDQTWPALGADYVVSGSCRQIGLQIVIHGEVRDARCMELLHAFRHVSAVSALAATQSPVTCALLAEVADVIVRRQIEMSRSNPLPSLAAHSLLIGGIALLHRLGRQDFARARDILGHLGDRFPRHAAPAAWMARWHLLNYMQGRGADPAAESKKARAFSQRALDLDAQSSVALAVAGSVTVGLDRDVNQGISLYEEALRANPSDSFAWMLLGTAHAFKGHGAPAAQASSMALRLSPFDPMHFMYDCHAAGAALAAGEYARARDLATRSLQANAEHLSTFRVLAIAHQLLGEMDSARTVVARLLARDPQQSVAGYLRNSPSAQYPIGQKFAVALGEAGLPTG